MEFNGTIYLSKLTGITFSRSGASRKVHAPQLQRYLRTGREFWLLYCYYFRSTWRMDLINVSKLASAPIKEYLNSQAWSPAVILQTLQWGEVAPDWIVSSSRCAGRGGHIWTFLWSFWGSFIHRHKNGIKTLISQLAQRVEVWVCMCWETWEQHMMKIQLLQGRSLDESRVRLLCPCSSRVSC